MKMAPYCQQKLHQHLYMLFSINVPSLRAFMMPCAVMQHASITDAGPHFKCEV